MAATAVEAYQRLRGGPASQEITYGWYPPAKSVWKNYRVKSNTYDNELLYKHNQSRFIDGSHGCNTPIAPTPIRMHLSPRPASRSKSPNRPLGMTRSQSRVQSARVSKTPKPPSTPARSVKSAGSYRTPPVVSGGNVSRSNAWEKYGDNHGTTSLDVRPPSVARDTVHVVPTSTDVTTTAEKIKRVQSAPAMRSPMIVTSQEMSDNKVEEELTTPKPVRVQSAHVPRTQYNSYKYRHSKTATQIRAPPKVMYPRPFSATPVPPEDESRPFSTEPEQAIVTSQLPTKPAVSYEEQLDKYGWRMQVHGDPLKLKQVTLLERKPYTVKVPDAQPTIEGPKGHMENWDTYFYNTIPTRKACFDVHQDWISEVIHAKRMELQKREGGIKYRYKNFAFVY